MNAKKFSIALGEVNEKYVTEAIEYKASANNVVSSCENTPNHKNTYHRRFSRKVLLSVALVAALLISSFTIAMAASEEFRNAVFSFFMIDTPDVVLPPEVEPEPADKIEIIGKTSVSDLMDVEYVRINGKFDYKDGVIYLYGSSGTSEAYTVTNGQLTPVNTKQTIHRETFDYEWNGEVYSICFDWYEADGKVYADGNDFNIDTSGAWNVTAIADNTEYVLVTVSFGQQIEYNMYPLLYNLKTREVIEVLGECAELTAQQITETTLSPDLSGVLLTRSFGTVSYYNITDNSLLNLSDLCGMEVTGGWFIDNNTIACLSANEDQTFTCGTLDLSTGEYKEIFRELPRLKQASEGGIKWTGGRYGLFVDDARTTYVYDFRTGNRTPVENFLYPDDAFTIMNNTGDKFLFAKKDDTADGLGVSEIGVLDLETQTLILFDREGYERRKENSISWFDDDTVAIWASLEDYGYLYLFTIKTTGINAET